jgi:hypothetical protein
VNDIEKALAELRIKLRKRCNREESRVSQGKLQYEGNEQNYTYHGGWDMGYHQGKLTMLEDLLDELNDLLEGYDAIKTLQIRELYQSV